MNERLASFHSKLLFFSAFKQCLVSAFFPKIPAQATSAGSLSTCSALRSTEEMKTKAGVLHSLTNNLPALITDGS